MGQFSWLDCKTREQVLDDVRRDVFVLVPKEFGGGHIKEKCYDGYGNFGEYDIYELVAIWNRETATKENMREPKREEWGIGEDADRWFASAHKRYLADVEKLELFKEGIPEEAMVELYGENYLRLIGINIACYDEQNAALAYPIKITHDPEAIYEDCGPSDSDPNQGWQY